MVTLFSNVDQKGAIDLLNVNTTRLCLARQNHESMRVIQMAPVRGTHVGYTPTRSLGNWDVFAVALQLPSQNNFWEKSDESEPSGGSAGI